MSSNGERRAKILKVAKESVSYAEAGRKLGISRERVRQIAGPFVARQIAGYETLSKLAERHGYVVGFFIELAKSGGIPARKIGGRWYVTAELELDFGSCVLCGKPLEKKRYRYCSKECLKRADSLSHARSTWRKLHRLKGQRVREALKLQVRGSLRLLRVPRKVCVGKVK